MRSADIAGFFRLNHYPAVLPGHFSGSTRLFSDSVAEMRMQRRRSDPNRRRVRRFDGKTFTASLVVGVLSAEPSSHGSRSQTNPRKMQVITGHGSLTRHIGHGRELTDA
jgi:hypothetical protein